MIRMGVLRMKRCTHTTDDSSDLLAILSRRVAGFRPGGRATQEHGTTPALETREEEHAEEAEHEEHGESEGHGGSLHHKNDVAIFLGGTDEHGHPTEFTWGLDYKRRVAERWAVGGLFDHAGGSLRNAIVAASVTWLPVGKLSLTAAPGIEFHRGRSSNEGCGCGESAKERGDR